MADTDDLLRTMAVCAREQHRSSVEVGGDGDFNLDAPRSQVVQLAEAQRFGVRYVIFDRVAPAVLTDADLDTPVLPKVAEIPFEDFQTGRAGADLTVVILDVLDVKNGVGIKKRQALSEWGK